MAMAEQAPRMYRELRVAKTLKLQIEETANLAQTIYDETLEHLQKNKGMGDEAQFMASEIVFHDFIQFPQE